MMHKMGFIMMKQTYKRIRAPGTGQEKSALFCVQFHTVLQTARRSAGSFPA